MNPDRDIQTEIRQILEQATPNRPDSVTDKPGPTAREVKIRLQIAFYAAIAAFGLAVFFYGASRIAAHIRIRDPKPINTVMPDKHTFRKVAFTDTQISPIGKLTAPVPNAVTDRTVTITGYTENIPVDTPFVWLIVDVPSIGRCWPKKPAIQPNSTFQTTIFEGGPNMDYTVSLYAVGYGLNKTVEAWFDAGTFGGLPLMPPQYRLDSVNLSLNGV